MNKALYSPPLKHVRNIYTIDSDIIEEEYILLSGPTQSETLFLIVQDWGSLIYSVDYILVEVTLENHHNYPKSIIGDFLISWRQDDIPGNTTSIIFDISEGLLLDIRYIVLEWKEEPIIIIDHDDHIDCEND